MAQVIPSTDQFEMYPLGMTSIAAYLAKNNYRVRIVNLAGRMVADPAFDAVTYLRRLDARVFGIDLHWLPHAHGALAVARRLREMHPRSRILLGGLSSTYYHEELIADPAVDFVIRGDSTEEPCRRLLQALRGDAPLESVPNLTWRRPDGTVAINPHSYVPGDVDAFEIPAYEYMVRSVALHGHLADLLPYEGWLEQPLTVLLNGRGCTLDCAICGGSRTAYRMLCGRAQPALRSPERLIGDLRAIRSFSRSPVFMIHDPRVGGASRARRFFELLARERMPNELVFELFFPAGREFYAMVGRSVPRWSLQLTIETQDERLRASNGKFACPNAAVEETIALALEHGCRTLDLFFMIGVPGQTYASALAIGDYCEELLERFGAEKRLRPFVAPLAPFLDPGSRAFEDPSLGYRVLKRTLADHEHALLEPDWGHVLTFETDEMSREELVDATYAVAARINDLNLRYGLTTRPVHDSVDRGLRSARTNVATFSGGRADRTWSFAKEEMVWPGPKGLRPTPRLAWTILTGLAEEVARVVSRAAGRYDTHVVPVEELAKASSHAARLTTASIVPARRAGSRVPSQTGRVTLCGTRAAADAPAREVFGGTAVPLTKESLFETLHIDQEGIDRVIEKTKNLIHEGNVRRLLVKNAEGVTLIEVPLTVGVVGAVLVPVWAAIAAIATMVVDATVIVEKRDEGGVGDTA